MEYRQLGNSEIKVSAIAFGAWAIGGWMWGGADKQQAIDAIYKAFDMGITTFDTAPVYGFGQSEEIVGDALKGLRQQVQILTKYGLRWDTDKGKAYFDSQTNDGTPVTIHKYAAKESIIKECEDSLRRLQTDYIDLYQIHWPDPTTPVEETMEAVTKLLKDGKIRAAGVSNYPADLMRQAAESADIISNQVPYSMVNRDIEKHLVPYCVANQKAILAYSPMQRGLLTGKMTPKHQFSQGDHRASNPFFKTRNIEKVNELLKKIKPIADLKGVTLAQLVLNWTMNRQGITCVLAGARNPKQVAENAQAGNFTLDHSDRVLINTHLDQIKLDL